MNDAFAALDMLYNPAPFYTADNVPDTIAYIEDHPAPAHNEYMLAALRWVLSVLQAGAICVTYADERMIAAAAAAAETEHDKNVIARDFIAVMRWRYVMTACHDYRNYLLKARRTA